MAEGFGAVLIGLALVALVGFLYWADRRCPALSNPRQRVCARPGR
jgi:hypothetical protein